MLRQRYHLSLFTICSSCAFMTCYCIAIQNGDTALHAAARKGNLRVVEMVLEANANVNHKDDVRIASVL